MVNIGLIPNINIQFHACEPCIFIKWQYYPFLIKSNEPLVIVHFDVYGPLNVKTHKCLEHFITFIDEFSHYNYIYLMHKKFDVLKKSQVYKNEVENQLGRIIKLLKLI
jgi:hypothetical protein